LLTPRNHGQAAWVFTSTFGGGLVGGDRIRLHVEVGPDAALLLSTQASTKIYRSGQVTRGELHGVVRPQGLLAVLPDPIVCFAGARYEQYQQIDLDAAGSLVFLDWLTSGRHAAGERWAFHSFRSRLRIQQDGQTVLFDSTALDPQDDPVAARLGRFNVLAAVVLLGPRMHAAATGLVARVGALPIERKSDLLVSATPLGDGCVIRLAGESVERTGAWIRAALNFVPTLLGDDPWARKW
jgi:urease accessory protein